MPILLYCVSKRDVSFENPISGVAGIAVVRHEAGSLAVFTSRNPNSDIWLKRELRTSAVEFHRALSQVFKSSAIIPFRFPTIFEREEDLHERLRERAEKYSALLEKFADMVQMELRVTTANPPAPAGSGTDYLKQRQSSISFLEQFGSGLRTAFSPFVEDWRQHQLKDGLRVFALVARSRVPQFQNAIGAADVPSAFKVRVSGPWPAAEFLEKS